MTLKKTGKAKITSAKLYLDDIYNFDYDNNILIFDNPQKAHLQGCIIY